MKIIKLSSIVLFSLFFMWAFIPQLSAKHHRHHHHCCKSRTSFGFSLNVAPNYMVAPAPVVAPAVVAPAPVVYPYGPVAYPYPYYSAPAYVGYPQPGVYVQPGFSYTHWR